MQVSTGMVATVNGVSHAFAPGMPKVLADVSLGIDDGEFVSIVGRSGCGKTTLLNMLAGFIEPEVGDVNICGAHPADSRDQVAYMFARDALMPWRTVQKNVEIGLEIRGDERKERRARAKELLAMVQLSGSENKYPAQLSHGMRQRAAIARTLATDPRILLMDEPFAALDTQTRLSVQHEFLSLWETHKKSVVFVTHDLAEAITLSDRILVMNAGRIIQEYPVDFDRPRDFDEVRLSRHFQELYGEIHQMLQ